MDVTNVVERAKETVIAQGIFNHLMLACILADAKANQHNFELLLLGAGIRPTGITAELHRQIVEKWDQISVAVDNLHKRGQLRDR